MSFYFDKEDLSTALGALYSRNRPLLFSSIRKVVSGILLNSPPRVMNPLSGEMEPYAPMFSTESEEIAVKVAEDIAMLEERDLRNIYAPNPYIFNRYIFRCTIRGIYGQRYQWSVKEEFLGEFDWLYDNPDVREVFARLSGVEGNLIPAIDYVCSIQYLNKEDVFQYVMEKFCLYDSEAIERKRLSISLILTVTRKKLTLYHLEDKWKPMVIFLLNQFIRITQKCFDDGQYRIPE